MSDLISRAALFNEISKIPLHDEHGEVAKILSVIQNMPTADTKPCMPTADTKPSQSACCANCGYCIDVSLRTANRTVQEYIFCGQGVLSGVDKLLKMSAESLCEHWIRKEGEDIDLLIPCKE